MKKHLLLAFASFVVCVASSLAQYSDSRVASRFRNAFSGSAKMEQFNLMWSTDYNGYHAGEDWNQLDPGTNLYAIANGEVVASGSNQYQGNHIRVKYRMPYGNFIYSDYLHGNKPPTLSPGDKVKYGQKILEVGNTGTGSGTHLHWTMTDSNNTFKIVNNPYLSGYSVELGKYREPLTPQLGKTFISPSLVMDDWGRQEPFVIRTTGMNEFGVGGIAMSWKSYLKDEDGYVYSISDAINSGLIKHGIIFKKDGKWYRFTDPERSYYEPGVTYGMIANKPCTLFVCWPKHSEEARMQRAQRDMFQHAAKHSSKFAKRQDNSAVRRFQSYPNENFTGYMMIFRDHDGDIAAVTQVTGNKYADLRYVQYYYKGNWSDWERLDSFTPNY